MSRRVTAGAIALSLLAVTGAGVAAASGGGSGGGGSRLDDGKDLLGQATITEAQAIAAAQRAASGSLNEVDLEHYRGHLVFNVDVGSKDVKVDPGDGTIVNAATDDQ